MIDPALIYPDAPGLDEEPAVDEYACAHCPVVFTGADAWYELGAHEIEHLDEP